MTSSITPPKTVAPRRWKLGPSPKPGARFLSLGVGMFVLAVTTPTAFAATFATASPLSDKTQYDFTLTLPDEPEFGAGGPFQRALMVDLGGNLRLHSICIRNGRLVASNQPAYREQFEHFGLSTCTDLEALPLPGSRDGRWGVVVTSANAPQIINLKTGTSDPDDAFESTKFSDPLLAGALFVRAADFDLDGDSDLCFLGADRRSIYTVLQDSNAGWEPAALQHYAVRDILQLELGRLDPNPGPEIVVRSTAYLDVLSGTGEVLRRTLSLIDAGRDVLHIVRDVQPNNDRIAFVTAAPSGGQNLITMDAGTGKTIVPLASHEVVSMASGDLDLDGHVDLVGVLADGANTLVLLNQNDNTGGPEPLVFEPISGSTIILAAPPDDIPAEGVRPPLIIADVDRDEALDLTLFSGGGQQFALTFDPFEVGTLELGTGTRWIGHVDDPSFDFVQGEYRFGGIPQNGALMNLGLSLPMPMNPNINPDAFDVVVWKKNRFDDVYTNSMPESHCPSVPKEEGNSEGANDAPLKISDLYLPMPGVSDDYSDVALCYEIRLVAHDPISGHLIWAGPSVIGFVAFNAGAFAPGLVEPDGDPETFEFTVNGSGSISTGILAELLRVPRFNAGSFSTDSVPCRTPDEE